MSEPSAMAAAGFSVTSRPGMTARLTSRNKGVWKVFAGLPKGDPVAESWESGFQRVTSVAWGAADSADCPGLCETYDRLGFRVAAILRSELRRFDVSLLRFGSRTPARPRQVDDGENGRNYGGVPASSIGSRRAGCGSLLRIGDQRILPALVPGDGDAHVATGPWHG